MRKDARIVFEEHANVVDILAYHRDAFDADAERPTGHSVRIVTGRTQHLRMHHSRSADLDPAGTSARPAGASLQPGQVVSTSALGSVKGKNDGRKRTVCFGPKTSRKSPVSTPLRCPR